ncbi:hypothetical protein [Sulfuracidifex tepidarius]|nr:hypothetical protein [Sulfuracidifex tepidarius]
MIPQNSSVYTYTGCLPIASSHSWNSWFYGYTNKTYILFNSYSGPPSNLSGYGLYGVQGDFMLYRQNFTGSPVIDSYYLNASGGQTSPGQPYVESYSFFIPKGNYTAQVFVKSNGTYPKLVNYNFGNVDAQFQANDSYAVVQEFSVSEPITLGQVVIFGIPTYGYYGFTAEISTSLDPTTVIQSSSFAQYAYKLDGYEVFSFSNLELEPGRTYYLWVYTGGDPGGLFLQGKHVGNGLYYVKLSSNAVSHVSGSMKFSLVASNIMCPVIHPSNITITINNVSHFFTVQQSNVFTVHFRVQNSSFVGITLHVNEPYSYFLLTLSVHNHDKELHSFMLQEPYEVLLIFLIPSVALMFASLKLRRLSIPFSRLSWLSLVVLLGIFYITFMLDYFNLAVVSPTLLALEGIAVTVNLAFSFFSSISKKEVT